MYFTKFQRKGFGTYFVSKVFISDAQLDGRAYAVTISIQDYNLSGYKETESKYSDSVLYN